MARLVYDLEVFVRLQDKITAPLKAMTNQLRYADAQAKMMRKSLLATGATSKEIQTLQSKLDGLARSRAFSKLAYDLQGVGAKEYQINQVAKGLQRVADAEARIASGRKMLMKGGLSLAAGLGIGALMIDPIKNASEFQKAMLNTQISTGANAAQTQTLARQAMLSGLNTGLSSMMVSQAQQAMSKSGLPLNALMNSSVFSQYIKMADLLYQRQGTPVDTSTSSMTAMSHEYQLYQNPQKLSAFQQQLWRIMAVTHTLISNFQNIWSYFAQWAKRAGMSSSQALSLESFAIRGGLAANGRSGGADLKAFIQYDAAAKSKKATALMDKYGLIKNGQSVFFQNGKMVGMPQMISIMQEFQRRFHGNTAAEIAAAKEIWGQRGGQLALLLGGSNAKSMYSLLQKQQAAVPDINKAQGMQMNTVSGQMQRLKVGWQDMMTNLGLPQLSSVQKFLTSVNDIVKKIVKFQLAHPTMMKMVGDFAKLAAGALVFRGVLLGIGGAGKILSGAFHFTQLFSDFVRLGSEARVTIRLFGMFGGSARLAMRSLMILGSWIGRVTGLSKIYAIVQKGVNLVMRMNPVGLIITGLTLLGVAIYELIKHWKSVHAWLIKIWTWFNKVTGASKLFKDMAHAIKTAWSDVGTFFSNLYTKHIKPFVDALQKLEFWRHGGGTHTFTNNSTPSVPTGSMTVHHHNTTINVNGSGDPHTVATHVASILGQQAAINTRSNSLYPNRLAYGHS